MDFPEIYFDGYQIIYFTNGDIKQIFPDKSKQVYFFNESIIISGNSITYEITTSDVDIKQKNTSFMKYCEYSSVYILNDLKTPSKNINEEQL